MAALQQLDATVLDEDWFFSIALQQDDELLVIHSDPSRGKYEKRQLISVNGEVPDASRQKEFRQAEIKRVDDIDPDASGYRYMVDIDTLQQTADHNELIEFAFVPRIKAMEKSREQMRGVILLNANSQAIEKIEIHNTEQMSPAFSVTLESFQLVFLFQWEQGQRLLHKMESHAVGKAGFVKSFESHVLIDFSDYRPAREHPVSN